MNIQTAEIIRFVFVFFFSVFVNPCIFFIISLLQNALPSDDDDRDPDDPHKALDIDLDK